MNIDKLAKCTPINKTAAVVVSGGFNYSPTNPADKVFDVPPPHSKLSEIPKSAIMSGGLDFMFDAKFKFFRLTVIGAHALNNRHSTAFWVCKCSCGYYCLRKSRSLKAQYPCCGVCQKNYERKARQLHKAKGDYLTKAELDQVWQLMGGA